MIAVLAGLLLGSVDVRPCELDGQAAECGRVPVLENRARPRGRALDLNFVLIRHEPGRQTSDAVFIIGGGPGVGASGMADFAAERFKGAGRDLVLVDVRGTGQSAPLNCEFGGSDADVSGYLNGFLPMDRVRACREVLSKRADLTQYTTRAIVDDLEEVRGKLGYRAVNLYGSSYGTRVAQEYMRHYPDSVRLAVLDGVSSPSMVSPGTLAPDAQRAVDSILALCTFDAECRAAYPNLLADYRAMLSRIAGGVEFSVAASSGEKKERLRIDRGLFGEVFRNFLYVPEVYVQVPHIIHRAAQGDFEEFGATAVNYGRGIRTLSFGMFLSVTCTEDIPRLDLSAARQAAEGTLLGAYRIEQQVAACRVWPRGVADPARVAPLKSSIPTLLISGEFDPVTPPKYAAEVARTLSNARHVVIPKGSHANESNGCVDRLAAEMVRVGAVAELDVSCVEKLAEPKLVVKADAG